MNSKVVILAGGRGTRLMEETDARPKPMVEIGGRPILWHIMKVFSVFGFNDFIICAGYKSYMIKEYFSNYFLHDSDITFNVTANGVEVHHSASEPWRVTIVDTGLSTMTGGRLKRVQKYLNGGMFLLTYGDGLANVDIGKLVEFHKSSCTLATVTAVPHPGRFGVLDIENDLVRRFVEKPPNEVLINGGFFVLEPDIFDYLDGDDTVFEKQPLERLAETGQLSAYVHKGFWHPMDTLRDRIYLQDLWDTDCASWAMWKGVFE